MNFNPENPFSVANCSDPDHIRTLFEDESSYIAASGYTACDMLLDREEATRLITKFEDSCSVDPVVPFLAVIYFDNFFSKHPLPKKLKERNADVRLVTTCCFISAWRMINSEFYALDFLMKHNLNFKLEDVVQTLDLIDQWLDTRNCKRPVTAFCFLDYFIGLLTEFNEDQKKCLKTSASETIYGFIFDARFTELKPSMMTAAALACTIDTLYEEDRELEYFACTLMNCEYVNQERLKITIEMVVPYLTLEMISTSPSNAASSPGSSSNITAEPILQPPQNLDSADAAEADNATTTEASVERNVAQDNGASSSANFAAAICCCLRRVKK